MVKGEGWQAGVVKNCELMVVAWRVGERGMVEKGKAEGKVAGRGMQAGRWQAHRTQTTQNHNHVTRQAEGRESRKGWQGGRQAAGMEAWQARDIK